MYKYILHRWICAIVLWTILALSGHLPFTANNVVRAFMFILWPICFLCGTWPHLGQFLQPQQCMVATYCPLLSYYLPSSLTGTHWWPQKYPKWISGGLRQLCVCRYLSMKKLKMAWNLSNYQNLCIQSKVSVAYILKYACFGYQSVDSYSCSYV